VYSGVEVSDPQSLWGFFEFVHQTDSVDFLEETKVRGNYKDGATEMAMWPGDLFAYESAGSSRQGADVRCFTAAIVYLPPLSFFLLHNRNSGSRSFSSDTALRVL
jgi:hypothetical protein